MPTTEWLNKYEAIKDKLTCKDDLEAHFTEKVIGNMAVDVLDIGTVHFPTGQIFACDPLVELEDTLPFLQTIPAGTYPVKICVVPSEQYGDRYACVKVEVSQEKPGGKTFLKKGFSLPSPNPIPPFPKTFVFIESLSAVFLDTFQRERPTLRPGRGRLPLRPPRRPFRLSPGTGRRAG